MLFRIVTIPKPDFNKVVYNTDVVCTECGHKNKGTSYKADMIVSIILIQCTQCGHLLNNQELLNKKVASRLEYHQSE